MSTCYINIVLDERPTQRAGTSKPVHCEMWIKTKKEAKAGRVWYVCQRKTLSVTDNCHSKHKIARETKTSIWKGRPETMRMLWRLSGQIVTVQVQETHHDGRIVWVVRTACIFRIPMTANFGDLMMSPYKAPYISCGGTWSHWHTVLRLCQK